VAVISKVVYIVLLHQRFSTVVCRDTLVRRQSIGSVSPTHDVSLVCHKKLVCDEFSAYVGHCCITLT